MVDGWTHLGRILQYTPLQRSIPTALRARSWDIPEQLHATASIWIWHEHVWNPE